MKASVAWLKELLPGLRLSPQEIAERFTSAGIEVEGLAAFGFAAESTKVAWVVSTRPHPSKDRLKLVTIDFGEAPLELVCGAPNVPAAGGLVVYAPEGCQLTPDAKPLLAKEIAGVLSRGMLCSERELGLVPNPGGDDPGLLILEGPLRPGASLASALPASADVVLELSLTPSRSDALGHIGLARELGAVLDLPFTMPKPQTARASRRGMRIPDLLDEVRVGDSSRCPRYGAAAARGLRIGPSPLWLRYRLERLGIRSISTLVDITNYLMLMFGHPMHAFDATKIRGKRIFVRQARAGEPLTTLDGATRKLHIDDCVIADTEGPTALAGVMGGLGSEIGEATREVVFECAAFDPRSVRRTSRRHGLHSESSHRFERGIDPSDIDLVLDFALSLTHELAGGDALADRIVAGPELSARAPIVLRLAQLRSLTGADLNLSTARATLTRLGCALSESGTAALSVVPPYHRPDLNLEADLIEEVIRIAGLDVIPRQLPAMVPNAETPASPIRARARQAALSAGLSEGVCYGFVSPKSLAAVGAAPAAIRLLNPLTEERSVMRTSLLVGLLESSSRSLSRGAQEVRLFTLGNVFQDSAGERLPKEIPWFAGVLTGSVERDLQPARAFDVYDIKGVALAIVREVLRREPHIAAFTSEARPKHLHPRAAARLLVDGTSVGSFGLLHPATSDGFELKSPAGIVELNLATMETIGLRHDRFKAWPTTPSVVRDIALVVHDDHEASTVATSLREGAGPLCESVSLFDLFRGKGIPEEHRSLAFHLTYREATRTLTDKEVDAAQAAAAQHVQAKLGAQIR